MSRVLAASLAFIAVAFGVIAVALLAEGIRWLAQRRDLAARLSNVITDLQEDTMIERSLLDPKELRQRQADLLTQRLPFMSGATSLLIQSGLDWSPTTLVTLMAGFGLASGVLTVVARVPIGIALVLVAVFGSTPWLYVRHRRNKLLKRFEEQLPDAIDYLARAIRAGHPLSSGIQMVAEELSDPLASEFRRIFDQQRFGVPFEEALLGLCDRVHLVDIRIFATSIIVQREVGGVSFGEVLDNMAETIRSRFAIRREINVFTAQGRLSGLIVGAMPFAVGVGIYLQDPKYVRLLFTHPIGRAMAMSAIMLQIIGFIWIRKIVDVEI